MTGFCSGYLCGMNINELKPDGRNYNKGTDKGRKLVKRSLKELGAGRSVLVDKDGNIIAGNKTVEAAKALGIDDVVIVKTTGRQLVAVQRTDIELDSEKGRALALADNATASAGLEWNYETLAHDWGNDMLEGWGVPNADYILSDALGESFEIKSGDKPPFESMSFTFSSTQAESVKNWLKMAKNCPEFTTIQTDGNNSQNGNALFFIISEWAKQKRLL